MLIIAIPKSASTSLLRTLGSQHNIPSTQEFDLKKKHPIPNTFTQIAKLHSDCVIISNHLVNKWTRDNKFYKQHIPPTDENLLLLSGKKKVILLREPKEIILAYRRGQLSGVHSKINGFEGCHTEAEWLSRALENGIFQELSLFYDKWRTQKNMQSLIIHYVDLINDPTKVINDISEFYSLRADFIDISLEKSRYSKHNTIQRFLYRVIKKINRLIK